MRTAWIIGRRPALSGLPLVIDGARAWRIARDTRRLVQPALYARLAPRGAGMLAPALDGLLVLFEASLGRCFRAGGPSDRELTGDERQLLTLLDGGSAAAARGIAPTLGPAIQAALRSTRIMLGLPRPTPRASG